MKLKTDWLAHLHQTRLREFNRIFESCPEQLFASGLELGAGDGFQSTLLSKYVKDLTCTDIDPHKLNRQSQGNIQYRICDAEELGTVFGEKQFDLVFSSNLLEHIPRVDKTLHNIHRILKDDGITIHVMPTRFWKLWHFLLYVPNLLIIFLETLTGKGGWNEVRRKLKVFNRREAVPAPSRDLGNNPKVERPSKPLLYRIFIPEPHGIASNNVREFILFGKNNWIRTIEAAGFNVVRVIKGPVSSGHGFGLDWIRNILEKLGFTSDYIYVARKKTQMSPYEQYFKGGFNKMQMKHGRVTR
jgi:SAM-dependent methyltransferase